MPASRAILNPAAGLACALLSAIQAAPVLADYAPRLVATWGTYGSGPGQFDRPVNVAVAPDGSVYTLELGNSRIQRFSSAGGYLTQWGQQGTGHGQFASPFGLAVGLDGAVYESEDGISRIQKFDANGTFILQFGATSGPCHRTGLWADADGFFYAARGNCDNAQVGGSAVDKYIPLGTLVITLDAYAGNPNNLTGDAKGNLFFVGPDHAYEISTLGILINSFGSIGPPQDQLRNATGIAVDPRGIVLVANTGKDRIVAFDPAAGSVIGDFGGTGAGPTQMSGPQAIAVAPDGTIYVADTGNNRIDVYAPPAVPAAGTSWGRFKSMYR